MKTVALALGGFVLLVVVCVGVMSFGLKKQQEDQEKKVQEQQAIEVTAAQLHQEFKDNEVKGNDKYKGKVVQVTGTIERITEGEVDVRADEGPLAAKIYCSFSGDERKVLATLTKGTVVAIKGICDGKAVFPGVKLSSCKLVSGGKGQQQAQQNVEEPKLIEVSADQLIREYKDNEAKANNTYKRKTLRIIGPIERITENYVVLKGADQLELLKVRCYFDDRRVMAELTSGNQVTITGVCDGGGFLGIDVRRCQLAK